MKLELDSRLRAFAAIARQHSFSRAAEELLISQPAVSRHIADLEKDLGMQLVVRNAQEVKLTPAGEYLAQYVLRAEALLAQAIRGLKPYTHLNQVTLHVAASGTPGNYLLPSILSTFQQSYAGVTVDIILGTSDGVIEAVRANRAELGIVGGLANFDELEVEPIYIDEVVLIGNPTLASQQMTPHELRNFSWLIREVGSSTRQVVEAAWKDLGIHPRSLIELPSWEAIKQAVSSGSGIAACSRLAIGPEVKSGALSVLKAPAWNVHRTISLIKIAGVELSPVATWFRQALLQHLEMLESQ